MHVHRAAAGDLVADGDDGDGRAALEAAGMSRHRNDLPAGIPLALRLALIVTSMVGAAASLAGIGLMLLNLLGLMLR
jgi:hypothetical protein